MDWNYQRNEQTFTPIPEGAHRIRIKSADKAVSKSGSNMLALQFEVSGYNSLLYHYIVFMEDKPEITNRNLTQFFDSFKGIQDGDLNINNWIGKVGACMVKHDEYNGQKSAKVRYFIKADQQDTLPPWREPGTISTFGEDFTDDLPF